MRYCDANNDDKELLQADFDMGETLYSSIIPRAVVYFTGEGIDDFDDDFDEDEDFGEEDEDDEDDDEDDEVKPTRRSGRRRGNASGQEPPECKNQ